MTAEDVLRLQERGLQRVRSHRDSSALRVKGLCVFCRDETGGLLTPAELVEPVVVDAEVVGDFMDDRYADFFLDLFLG